MLADLNRYVSECSQSYNLDNIYPYVDVFRNYLNNNNRACSNDNRRSNDFFRNFQDDFVK